MTPSLAQRELSVKGREGDSGGRSLSGKDELSPPILRRQVCFGPKQLSLSRFKFSKYNECINRQVHRSL